MPQFCPSPKIVFNQPRLEQMLTLIRSNALILYQSWQKAMEYRNHNRGGRFTKELKIYYLPSLRHALGFNPGMPTTMTLLNRVCHPICFPISDAVILYFFSSSCHIFHISLSSVTKKSVTEILFREGSSFT